ncbi:glycosyltransferase [Haloglomus litoreum]|uniref:glycosyltransferase n=1 Tax=Haloglomus litoreum TaxID=3034026 RepID=UPI0023E76DF0|nr:glycosyltransferase [Haloglomus sp. DT116]
MTGPASDAPEAVETAVTAPPEHPRDALVSVVVPTYERADRVGGAIESALDQTHDRLEVVVVNDGSTDDTRAVVAEYADAHEQVRALHNDRNRGISHTRNRGIEAADGAYVCQLDDDDRWRPRKVERQLAALDRLREREGHDPADYCGVYCGGVVRDSTGEVVRRVETGAAGDLWPDVLVRFDVRPHSGHLVRRDCIEAVGGYDESFPRGVDWDLTVRLCRHWRWAYVPEPLVERRYADDNVSGDAAFGDPSYEVAIRERLRGKYADDLAANPDARRRFEAMLAKQRGLAALERGDRRRAVRQLARTLRLAPEPIHAAMLGLGALGRRAYRAAWRAKQSVVGT